MLAKEYDFSTYTPVQAACAAGRLHCCITRQEDAARHLGDTSPGTLGFHLRLQLIVTPQLPGLRLQDLHLCMQGLRFLRQDKSMMYLDLSADRSGKSQLGAQNLAGACAPVEQAMTHLYVQGQLLGHDPVLGKQATAAGIQAHGLGVLLRQLRLHLRARPLGRLQHAPLSLGRLHQPACQ